MRLSRYHAPTLKEAPRDAELASHVYLIRGGFIRQLAAGIYDFLPLGTRVLQKVSNIIREELNRAGAMEVLLPAVQPADLWKESGRWDYYGPELLRFRDRHDREFCFGPTHEEVITDLVRRDIRSYRDLPVNLYQIQVKFRDEIKPRAGLMRGREFIMKDGYSFDTSIDAAKETYQAMYDAYHRIFNRCGMEHRAVEADTGNIGGSLSHEFQVVADTGEDYVFQCPGCGFTVNQELAPIPVPAVGGPSTGRNRGVDAPPTGPAIEKIHTPDAHTVEQVCGFLGIEAAELAKTLIYVADGEPVAILVRGDHALSETKLRRVLGCDLLVMANDETVEAVTKAPVGFAGPVGLLGLRILADQALAGSGPLVVGANEGDHHHRNAALGRDFEVAEFGDLREALEGDPCGRCDDGRYRLFRGIEVGHVFYLGTKYSEAMHCTFLDEGGKEQPAVMGCYGIGVTRIIAAAIEQHHDDKGIAWPMSLAPFQVEVIGLQAKDEEVMARALELSDGLEALGLEVLFDDRDERPGVKFKDADLVGIPLRVVIARRGLDQGTAEVVTRATGALEHLPLAGLVEELRSRVDAALAALRG
ncbi:MAG: proline--tRNA ligase [Pseudomonadota bacterium]